jgi:hypothetical protein
VLRELVFELHVIFTSVANGFICPFLEPFIQSIRDENAVGDTWESLLPCCVFCAREANVDCWWTNCCGVGKIRIKCIIKVVAIEVPKVVIREAYLVCVTSDFTEEEYMAYGMGQ